jgi:hypothetical protein
MYNVHVKFIYIKYVQDSRIKVLYINVVVAVLFCLQLTCIQLVLNTTCQFSCQLASDNTCIISKLN